MWGLFLVIVSDIYIGILLELLRLRITGITGSNILDGGLHFGWFGFWWMLEWETQCRLIEHRYKQCEAIALLFEKLEMLDSSFYFLAARDISKLGKSFSISIVNADIKITEYLKYFSNTWKSLIEKEQHAQDCVRNSLSCSFKIHFTKHYYYFILHAKEL